MTEEQTTNASLPDGQGLRCRSAKKHKKGWIGWLAFEQSTPCGIARCRRIIPGGYQKTQIKNDGKTIKEMIERRCSKCFKLRSGKK